MRSVHLYGELRNLVGQDVVELEVSSPAEAVRALVKQVPGAHFLVVSTDWEIFEGDQAVEVRDLTIQRQNGRAIHLVPALSVGGQSQGASIGKVVGGILLAIFTLGIGAPLGTGLIGAGLTGFIALAGVATALGGISNLLAPAPTLDPMLPERADDRQSYTFTAASNLRGDGHPIPLAYGEGRIGSVSISQRIEIIDTTEVTPSGGLLTSKARATIVDLLSEGEIEGLVTGDAGSILLNGTRVLEADGSVNFQDVEWDLALGAPGEQSQIFGAEQIFGVNTELKNATGDEPGRLAGAVVRTVSDPNVTDVRITLGIPQLFEISAGDIVDSSVEISIEIDANGAGYVPGPFSGDNSGSSYTAAYNTPGDTGTESGTGLDMDAQIVFTVDPGPTVTIRMFHRVAGASVWNEIVLVRDVVPHTGGTWTVVPIDADVYTPATGTYVRGRVLNVPWKVREFYWVCDEGEPLGGISSDLAVFPKTASFVVNGRTTSFYEFDASLENLADVGSPPWSIRLSKNTIDKTDPAVAVNPIQWTRYAEGISRTFTYEDLARIRITFDAEDVGGSIPTRLYEAKGIKIRVPDNLTPATRTYTGVWSGTFASARVYYDNPIWILLDVLTSSRYGLGIPDSMVDLWSFYEAAKWCDEPVASALGGTEPRAVFNHVFTTRESPERTVALILSSCQASPWYGNGKIFVVVDRPISGPGPRIFTNSNVVEGRFAYQMLGRSAQISTTFVQWRNPANGYATETLDESRPYMADRFGDRDRAVVAVGATSEGQARRRGRYELLSNELEGVTVQFRVGALDALMEPGEIVEISDQFRQRIRLGGRVVNYVDVGGGFIKTDASIVLDVPASYTIRIALDDGSVHETTPIHGGPTTPPDTLWELTDHIPGGRTIVNGAVWIVSELVPSLWRVIGIDEVGPNEYEVSAVQHSPAKQALVEDFDDRGAPLVLPLAPTLNAPTLDSQTPTYDPDTDTWSVVFEFTHDDPTLAYWGLLSVVLGAETFTATTSGTVAAVFIGLHDDYAGAFYATSVRSATIDGGVVSALDSAPGAIPLTRP